MSSIEPECAVPPQWMHPDLRRQIEERMKHGTQGRISCMSRDVAQLRRRVSSLETLLAEQQLQQQTLTHALQEVQQDMQTTEQLRQQAEQMAGELQRQALFQRTYALPSLVLTRDERAADTILGDVEEDTSEHTRCTSIPTPQDRADQALQPLMLSCLSAYMAPLVTRGTHASRAARQHSAREFCAQYAPLFTWNEAEACVELPRFVAEPCAIEQCEHTSNNDSSCNDDDDAGIVQGEQSVQEPVVREASRTPCVRPSVVQCRSAACLYWHCDQLRHVKHVLRPLLHAVDTLCVQDARLCSVRDFFVHLQAFVRACSSLQSLCGHVAWALHVLIARGWHEVILRASHTNSNNNNSRNTTGSSRTRSVHGWPAPLLANTPGNQSVPTAGTSGAVRIDHFRYAAEGKTWLGLLRNSNSNNTTSNSTEEAAASAAAQGEKVKDGTVTSQGQSGLAQRATAQFLRRPNAITWRCIMRALLSGSTAAGRVWLAERGVVLFPCVGALHVSRVFALLESIYSDERVTAQECVQACLSAAHSLAVQAAAATLVADFQGNEEHNTNSNNNNNTAATQTETHYAALVARQTAFMIARCAVVLASHEPTMNEAQALLETVVGHAGPTLGLTPVALTNLTLMLIVLKQTGRLPASHLLPLGAISDELWAVAAEFAAAMRPQEVCGRLLNHQLELLSLCEKDRTLAHGELLAAMRSAVQLSLLRLYALELQYVEQIVRKSALLSEHTQGVLWAEYVGDVAQYDSASAASAVARQVVQLAASKQDEEDKDKQLETSALLPSCLVFLLTTWWLDIYGTASAASGAAEQQEAQVRNVCTAFLAHFHSTCQDLAAIYAEPAKVYARCEAKEAAIPRIELAAFFILLSSLHASLVHDAERSEEQDDEDEVRLRWLAALPCELFVAHIDAFTLVLIAQLRLSAGLRSLPYFAVVLERGLIALRERHLLWWSPLDTWYETVVGSAHVLGLFVYRHIPLLVAQMEEAAVMPWRRAVLAIAERLGVLHPLLRDEADGAVKVV